MTNYTRINFRVDFQKRYQKRTAVSIGHKKFVHCTCIRFLIVSAFPVSSEMTGNPAPRISSRRENQNYVSTLYCRSYDHCNIFNMCEPIAKI